MDVTFRLAEDYPVDLYYVMDLSKSMDDDKDKLAELGTDLGERFFPSYVDIKHFESIVFAKIINNPLIIIGFNVNDYQKYSIAVKKIILLFDSL